VLYAVTNRNVYSQIGTLFGGFVDVIRISITSVLLFAIAGYANQDMIVELPGGATMDLVYIEPGTFMMGSLSSEWKHQANEGPQHEVTISRGFYLGAHEVTQSQWESVMGTGPWIDYFKDKVWTDQFEIDPTHPAVWVSWSEAQAFVQALNAASGDSLYRLPSEAEWEYSARAGTTTLWSFGDEIDQLNQYSWNEISAITKAGQPVGTKLPNPWGLYDMHGNVEEWCQDWYGPYSNGSQVDPQGPSEGTNRVVRGSSFRTKGYSKQRVAFRYGIYLGNGNNNIGFRVLMIEPQSSVPTVVNSRSWGLIKADK
jgi:formylglycine-generating enzyme required for sulfatase activity